MDSGNQVQKITGPSPNISKRPLHSARIHSGRFYALWVWCHSLARYGSPSQTLLSPPIGQEQRPAYFSIPAPFCRIGRRGTSAPYRRYLGCLKAGTKAGFVAGEPVDPYGDPINRLSNVCEGLTQKWTCVG